MAKALQGALHLIHRFNKANGTNPNRAGGEGPEPECCFINEYVLHSVQDAPWPSALLASYMRKLNARKGDETIEGDAYASRFYHST